MTMEQVFESYRGYLQVLSESSLPAMLKSKVDPADVVQITLMKAFDSQEEIRGREPDVVRAWLRAIMNNSIVDLCRYYGREKRDVRREKKIHAELDQSHAGLEALLKANHTSPSMAAARNEDLIRLSTAISTLPEKMKYVLIEKHFKKRPIREIAAETQQSLPTVAGLLRRALAKLRDDLS